MISNDKDFRQKCESSSCRSCGHAGLFPVLDLGRMPLSDGLLTQARLAEPEGMYPLEVAYCPRCTLVQILETVPADKLFCEDYPYYSSFSDDLLAHSRDNVLFLIEKHHLGSDHFVVELASNDGYLLKNYLEAGIPCLGIDPADGPAAAAEKIGVSTRCEFFTKELARQLADKSQQADIIHANNVLAHVPDTNGFAEGIRILLKDSGTAVIEVPYVRNLIDHCEFDTIYHEHLCYFSVTALDHLFRRHDLFLNDLKLLSIHGGSLRLYVEHQKNVQDPVREILKEEKDLGITQYPYYEDFSAKVREIGETMREMLSGLKAEGKRIAAYGAAAKGTIMLNHIQAGPDLIDFVVDRNVHKQGKYMPGMHIPISDPARIMEEMPDYVLILPWNFKDEIISQQKAFHDRGGKFIIPIPKPEIL